MGMIRAAAGAALGAAKDQWQDAIEPSGLGPETLSCRGLSKKRGTNLVSNGSVIHVYDNQFMILTDGGRIIDYTGEPGYFVVDNSSQPSLFQGQVKQSLQDVWERFKFGGTTPQAQQVTYLNLAEIRGIKFGTRNPVNYFDAFYGAELFLRAFGTYSIRIKNPLLFYANCVPKNGGDLDADGLGDQFLNEFLEALGVAINKMSADGVRIAYLASKTADLSQHLSDALDESWGKRCGIEIVSVGIGSISYDDQSKKLIQMHSQGAMMQDPSIREGFVQTAIASGLQSAGSNPNGAGTAYMGMGMGMGAAGSFAQAVGQMGGQTGPAGGAGPRQKQPGQWFCPNCGTLNSGKFCTECGTKKPV